MRESWTKIETDYTFVDYLIRSEIDAWLKENAGLPHKDWESGVYTNQGVHPALYFMFKDAKVATFFAIKWL